MPPAKNHRPSAADEPWDTALTSAKPTGDTYTSPTVKSTMPRIGTHSGCSHSPWPPHRPAACRNLFPPSPRAPAPRAEALPTPPSAKGTRAVRPLPAAAAAAPMPRYAAASSAHPMAILRVGGGSTPRAAWRAQSPESGGSSRMHTHGLSACNHGTGSGAALGHSWRLVWSRSTRTKAEPPADRQASRASRLSGRLRRVDAPRLRAPAEAPWALRACRGEHAGRRKPKSCMKGGDLGEHTARERRQQGADVDAAVEDGEAALAEGAALRVQVAHLSRACGWVGRWMDGWVHARCVCVRACVCVCVRAGRADDRATDGVRVGGLRAWAETLGLNPPLPNATSTSPTRNRLSDIMQPWPSAMRQPPQRSVARGPSTASATTPPAMGVTYAKQT
eukprot:scaffold28481_cov129-Isochrysis_galbana.AAC.3